MQTNTDLIDEVQKELRDLKGFQRVQRVTREDFEETIDRYRRAASLSRGPDPGRSAAWTAIAQRIEHELRNKLKQLQSGKYYPPTAKLIEDEKAEKLKEAS